MTRTVTASYRYKRPPRKRKAVVIEAPTVVTAKISRRPNLEERAAAGVPRAPASREEGAAVLPRHAHTDRHHDQPEAPEATARGQEGGGAG